MTISVKATYRWRDQFAAESEIKASTMLANWKLYKDKPIIVVDGSGYAVPRSANATLTKAGWGLCVEKEGVAEGLERQSLPLVRAVVIYPSVFMAQGMMTCAST